MDFTKKMQNNRTETKKVDLDLTAFSA